MSDLLWNFPDLQGLQESPVDTEDGIFRPGADLDVVEFGTDAARRCADYLERDEFRGTGSLEVKAFFSLSALQVFVAAEFLQGVVETLPDGEFEVLEWSPIEDVNYLANYKASVIGSRFGENLWVGPPWETPPEGTIAFIVEPGLAFGTGEHPTTQMCLERLAELARNGKTYGRILDLGAGSGVLSAAARRFWPHAEVVATDLDPLCAEEVAKTFRLNGLPPESVTILCGENMNLLDSHFRERLGTFDLVVSNIYAEVLAELVGPVRQLLRDAESPWVTSGILKGVSSEKLAASTEKKFVCKAERSRLRLSAQGEEEWLLREFVKRALK